MVGPCRDALDRIPKAGTLPGPKDVLRCPCLLSLRGFRAIENRPQTTRLRKERLVPTTPHGRFGKSGRGKGAVDNVTAHRRSCVVGLQTARFFFAAVRGAGVISLPAMHPARVSA